MKEQMDTVREQVNGRNVKLNLLKGFACMGVVFIHVEFPGMLGLVVKTASCYAVPVFFMIAGFYAFGKNEAVIRRRAFKISRIFVIAYILFFLYGIVFPIKNHEVSAWFLSHFSWKTPILYIVFCTVDFAIPLWYLIAMAEIYIVWFFVVRKRKENLLIKTIPVLIVLRAVLSAYCDARELDWFWSTNFLTKGMLWFLIGYFLHTDRAEKIRGIASFKLVLTAVFGCLIVVLPTVLNLPIRLRLLGLLLFAISLFLLTLKDPSRSVCGPIEYIGEHLSLPIYILHTLVDGTLSFFLAKFLKIDTQGSVYLWCRPLIVLFCTIAASWLWITCKRRVRKWME